MSCWGVVEKEYSPTIMFVTGNKKKIIIYSIIEASLVSRMWSVRIQGMDISMGN